MSDTEKQPARTRRTGAGTAATGLLVAAAVVVAVLVVIRNARKVSPGPVPNALQSPTTDTTFAGFRAGLWRKTKALEKRYIGREQLLQGKLTPPEDSLLQLSRAGTRRIFAGLARLDSVPVAGRKAAQESLKAEYEVVKSHVNAFARLGREGSMISEDSLDAEVRKLIGK